MVWNVVSSQSINAYRNPSLQGNVRREMLHNLMIVENTSQGKNFVTGQKASMTNEVLTSMLQNAVSSLKPAITNAQSTSIRYNFSDAKMSESRRPGPSQDEQKQPEKSQVFSPQVIKAVENTEQGQKASPSFGQNDMVKSPSPGPSKGQQQRSEEQDNLLSVIQAVILKPAITNAQSTSIRYDFSDAKMSESRRPGPSQDEQKQPEKSQVFSPQVIKAVENIEQGKSNIDGSPVMTNEAPPPSLLQNIWRGLKSTLRIDEQFLPLIKTAMIKVSTIVKSILRIDEPYKLQSLPLIEADTYNLQSPSLVMSVMRKAETQPEKEQTLLTTKEVID